jgi:hypothetical protein
VVDRTIAALADVDVNLGVLRRVRQCVAEAVAAALSL